MLFMGHKNLSFQLICKIDQCHINLLHGFKSIRIYYMRLKFYCLHFSVPKVLVHCAEFIEDRGIVDGIYRLGGVASNIQRLR